MKSHLNTLAHWLRLVLILEMILGTFYSPAMAMSPFPALTLQSGSPPVVDAGSSQTSDEGEQVIFNGSVTDPDTPTGHTILWDFGDGITTTNTFIPTHVYTDDGTYTVTLIVTDTTGLASSRYKTIQEGALPSETA